MILLPLPTQRIDFEPTAGRLLEFVDDVGMVVPEHEPNVERSDFVARVWTVRMQRGGWRSLYKLEARN